MPPATTAKRSATQNSHRTHPYPRKDVTSSDIRSDMTSPISPTTPRAAAGPWQPEDDAQLLEARKHSLNWADISTQYFPYKTANACRKRHERLMDKRHSTEDWDSTKLEAMAYQYIQLREQMWKILAQAIDEKWQNVETKVSILSGHHYESANEILVHGERAQKLDQPRSLRSPPKQIRRPSAQSG